MQFNKKKVRPIGATSANTTSCRSWWILSPSAENTQCGFRSRSQLGTHWVEQVIGSRNWDFARTFRIQFIATHRTQSFDVPGTRANTGFGPNTPQAATSSQL